MQPVGAVFNQMMVARDPIRPGKRVELEVDCMENGTCIPGHGKALRRGKSRVIVHEEDLNRVHEMQESNWPLVEQAKAAFSSVLVTHVEMETKRKLKPEQLTCIRAYAQKEAYERAESDLDELNDAQRRSVRRYPGSWQAEFYKLSEMTEGAARGRKPLKAVKVIRDVEPELDLQAEMIKNTVASLSASTGVDYEKLTESMAKAFASAMKEALATTGRSKVS